MQTEGKRQQAQFPPRIAQAGDIIVNPIDGAEMVFIPAGSFLMGDDDQEDNPRRTVALSACWIYKDLVTVAQYRHFCVREGHRMPREPEWGWDEDNPVVNVSWRKAAAYAKWARASLPTEAQWEKAARGTDGRLFPWGNELREFGAWWKQERTAAVGRHGLGPYGSTDMAGNVAQWCKDTYDELFWTTDEAKRADPENRSKGGLRVLRGGCWLCTELESDYLRCAYRCRDAAGSSANFIGFRCAIGPLPA
jgi:iron(II)-dependent oxidoreductase